MLLMSSSGNGDAASSLSLDSMSPGVIGERLGVRSPGACGLRCASPDFCASRGGPPRPTDLPKKFDEVAAELGRTLDFFKVPKREKTEVLAAFAAHKGEVTAGYVENPKRG